MLSGAGRSAVGGSGSNVSRSSRVDAFSSGALAATIAPTVPLSKDLEALYDVLLHQKPTATHSTSGRELRELMQLSPKELDAKIRELENWNFRLNLDESKELSESVALGILTPAQTTPSTARSADTQH